MLRMGSRWASMPRRTSLANSSSGEWCIAKFLFVGFGERNAVANLPTHGLRSFRDSQGPVIFTLNDDFVAPLNLFKHGVNIPSKFTFCDTKARDITDHSGSSLITIISQMAD